jgi:hypothetical protein
MRLNRSMMQLKSIMQAKQSSMHEENSLRQVNCNNPDDSVLFKNSSTHRPTYYTPISFDLGKPINPSSLTVRLDTRNKSNSSKS